MIASGYAMPLCGRLLPGYSPKKACFLTTASPICLRMLMGWQVAHYHPAVAFKKHFSPETQLASWPAAQHWTQNHT